MPDLGDQVIYYTHEVNDGNSSTVDDLAFVTKAYEDGSVDLVIFPAGGPVRFARVREYEPDQPIAQAGLSYFREGGDPPDFAEFNHISDPRWQEMRTRQRQEMEACPPNAREDLKARHKDEQTDLDSELDGDNKGNDKGQSKTVVDKPAQKQPENPNLNTRREI